MSRRTKVLTAITAAAALAAGGSLLLITNSANASANCDSLLQISHRGAGGLAPENTAAAMSLAAGNGADVFEVDVQLTSDDKVVIMHDTNLARTTNAKELYPGREADPINTFSLDEIEALDAGSWYDDRFKDEKVPTLDKVPDYAEPDGVGVVVELKDPALNPGLVDKLDAEMTADSRWADLIEAGKVTFSSFDAEALKAMQKLRPDVPVVWVSSKPADDATLDEAATWADYYGTHYRTLGDGDIDRIEGHGLKSLLYTMDSPEAVAEGIDLGADAIISDYPNVLSAACGGGDAFPDANGVEISSAVANPDGDDTQPENGEYFVITNTTDAEVDVSGYHAVDAVGNHLVVGDGYTVPAGGELRVYSGPGTNTADRYYNDFGKNVLNNDGDSLGLFTADHALLDVFAY